VTRDEDSQCNFEETEVARNRRRIDLAAVVVPSVFPAAGKWLTALVLIGSSNVLPQRILCELEAIALLSRLTQLAQRLKCFLATNLAGKIGKGEGYAGGYRNGNRSAAVTGQKCGRRAKEDQCCCTQGHAREDSLASRGTYKLLDARLEAGSDQRIQYIGRVFAGHGIAPKESL
jgi:hypothetical protein